MGERSRNLRKDRVRPGQFSVVAWVQSAAYVLRLARRLTRLHPDLVHTNTLKAALYGGMAARLAGIPCVWHVRDRIAPDYLPSTAVHLVRFAARLLPTVVIINSQATLQTLAASRGSPQRGRVRPRCTPDTSSRGRVTVVIPSPVLPPQVKPEPWSRPTRRLPGCDGRSSLPLGRARTSSCRRLRRPFLMVKRWRFLWAPPSLVKTGFERPTPRTGLQSRYRGGSSFRGFRSEAFEELSRFDAFVHAAIIP